MSNRTLSELDRLAEPLHARIITREALATIQRLAYEAGRLGLVGVIDDPPMSPPLNVDTLAAATLSDEAEFGHQCPLLAKAIAAWYATLSDEAEFGHQCPLLAKAIAAWYATLSDEGRQHK